MDPSVLDVDESVFTLNSDLKEIYWDVVEEDLNRILETLGIPVYVGCFVDADHGVYVNTRSLHSLILLFVNNALIKSFSKRQNTVESTSS